jgi:hypothetical protein
LEALLLLLLLLLLLAHWDLHWQCAGLEEGRQKGQGAQRHCFLETLHLHLTAAAADDVAACRAWAYCELQDPPEPGRLCAGRCGP